MQQQLRTHSQHFIAPVVDSTQVCDSPQATLLAKNPVPRGTNGIALKNSLGSLPIVVA